MNKVTFEDKIALQEQSSIDVRNKITADDMNQLKNAINSIIEGGLETAIANAIKEENKKRYHVGSLIFDTKNINPATYLGFGTWQLWGSGCVPVGVDTVQTEFATSEKTGGGKSITLTSANLPSHSHSITKHTHSIPNHTHVGPSHSHTTPNHTHTWSGTTRGGGAHGHQIFLNNDANFPMVGFPGWAGSTVSINRVLMNQSNGTGYYMYAGGVGDHTHGYSGTTSSNNGGHTGAAGTGATGGWSGNTGEGGPTTTGSTGSGTAISTLQPYVTCYIWKRTA